ncbi:MAG: hypothetical protein ACT4OJ_12680 [Bacteroidota bacterium]
MKYSLLLIAVLAVAVLACNKDKFKTEPQVEVKSISPTSIVRSDVFTIKAEYTDDEGDLDSILLVYKWYNGNTPVRPPNAANPNDTIRFSFASLSLPAKTREADMQIQYEYQTNNLLAQGILSFTNVPSIRDTTATFGLILKDKAGHRSNYSESEKVRLQKQ